MMNKKNGFTLVELLAVISILGVVMILLVPTTLNSFYKAKGQVDDMEYKTVEDSAKMYIQDYDLKVKEYIYNETTPYTAVSGKVYNQGDKMSIYDFRVYAINNPITISIKDLISGGYYNSDCDYTQQKNTCKMKEECTITVGIKGEKVENDTYWVSKGYTSSLNDNCK